MDRGAEIEVATPEFVFYSRSLGLLAALLMTATKYTVLISARCANVLPLIGNCSGQINSFLCRVKKEAPPFTLKPISRSGDDEEAE